MQVPVEDNTSPGNVTESLSNQNFLMLHNYLHILCSCNKGEKIRMSSRYIIENIIITMLKCGKGIAQVEGQDQVFIMPITCLECCLPFIAHHHEIHVMIGYRDEIRMLNFKNSKFSCGVRTRSE